MVKRLYISVLAVLFAFIANGQSVKDAPTKLKSIWTQFHQIAHNIPAGKIYFIDYTVNAELRSGSNQAPNQRVQTWMSNELVTVKNEYVEMYSTNEYTATVFPKDKRVTITALSKSHNQDIRSQFAFNIIDSLFTTYYVNECTNIQGNKYQIQLLPKENGVKNFNVMSATFIIDWQANTMHEIRANMGPSGDIEKMKVIYNEISLDYRGTEKPFDFCKLYLSKDGLLEGKYKTFTLRDHRKKKS